MRAFLLRSLLPLAALLGCTSTLDIGDGCESDAAFCRRLALDCDTVAGVDDCGLARTVDCGSCAAPRTCGANGRPNVCGYVGISWTSGVSADAPAAFGSWRGQPVRVVGVWADDRSWELIEEMAAVDNAMAEMAAADSPTTPGYAASVAVPFTTATEGDLASCADGRYDAHFEAAAATLVEKLAANGAEARSYVRLGWQDNEACRWCPKNTKEDEAWKACFRNAAAAFRAASSDLVIVWDMNRRVPGDVSRLWPGDDVVDVVGIDFYDMAPHFVDEATWRKDLDTMDGGGPLGLESWVRFAQHHGKKLALPEWGLSALDSSGKGDNPYFIEQMYDFFWTHRDDLEYEALFNLQGKNYAIYPLEGTLTNPNAGARYLLLWSAR